MAYRAAVGKLKGQELMLITKTRRYRQVAAGAMLFWAGLAGAALLVTACSSSTTSTAAGRQHVRGIAHVSGIADPRGIAQRSSLVAAAAPSVTASPSGTSTFLAPSQDTNATPL